MTLDGTFAVVDGTIGDAVANLTRDIMTMQATGDSATAQELLVKYVVVRPKVHGDRRGPRSHDGHEGDERCQDGDAARRALPAGW